jgi:hypothetical protein
MKGRDNLCVIFKILCWKSFKLINRIKVFYEMKKIIFNRTSKSGEIYGIISKILNIIEWMDKQYIPYKDEKLHVSRFL